MPKRFEVIIVPILNKKHKYIIVLLIMGVISGCTKYQYDLGNGMKAIDVSSGNYMIVNFDGELVVEPMVQQFCKIGNYIFGYRADPFLNNPDGSSDFEQNLGYFELNIITEKITWNSEYDLNQVKARCGHLIRPIY